MNRGWMNRSLTLALALGLIAALTLFAGCSKKAEVVDDPAAGAGENDVTELPPPPQPEDDAQDSTPPRPDYENMDPAEYGVQDVFFAFDEYELSDEAMAILSANARIAKETGATLLVSGHCDERGTLEYNLALGEKRANAVRDYLISLGVPASKLRVTSYGENRPFATGSNEAAWAKNRRAHFERP